MTDEVALVVKPAILRDHSGKHDLLLFQYDVEVVGNDVLVHAVDVPEHTNGAGTFGAWVGLAIKQIPDVTYPVFRGLEKLTDDAKDSTMVIDDETYDTLYFEGERATKNGPYTLGIVRGEDVLFRLTVTFDVSVSRAEVDPGIMTWGMLGYVTLEEADQYVAEHYMSTEVQRVGWEALESADRAALLRRSFQVIELLPFTGHKTDPSQPTAFPRCPCTEVPTAIKFAQIEQALIGADEDANTDAKQYQKMLQWGIASYRIGNLSESMHEGGAGGGIAGATGITSATASRLLAPFMQGGYSIR